MSFLKGTALDYFKPFLDTPDDEPAWLKDYELFVKELLLNFGPYDALADAKVELDALIMKDSHKATRFFVDFFQLSMLCDYNDRALLQKAYSALPKRVKDEMTHFDHPSMLQELRDLVLRIDQRYWERKAELAHEAAPLPELTGNLGTSPPNQNLPMKHQVQRTLRSPRNRHKRDQTYQTSSVRMVNSPPKNDNNAWMVAFAYCVPVVAT